MPLSSEQQGKIKEALSSVMHNPCAVCGSRNWELQSELYFISLFDTQYKMPIEGKVYPVILVVCASCYNTLSFSARKMGLV